MLPLDSVTARLRSARPSDVNLGEEHPWLEFFTGIQIDLLEPPGISPPSYPTRRKLYSLRAGYVIHSQNNPRCLPLAVFIYVEFRWNVTPAEGVNQIQPDGTKDPKFFAFMQRSNTYEFLISRGKIFMQRLFLPLGFENS